MKLTESEWLALRAEYEAGATFRDLRRKTGKDRKTLARGLRSVGTIIRKGGHRVGMPAPWNSGPRTDPYRQCSVCDQSVSRIILANPPTCVSCYSKQRRETPAEKNRYLKRNYGMTLDQANALLAEQGGRCAVCLTPIDLFKKMWIGGGVVDHDHATGAIRGLLCQACNLVIGLAGDQEHRLAKAQHYLASNGVAGNGAVIHETAVLFHPIIMTNQKAIKIGPECRIDSFVKLEGGMGLEIGPFVHLASGAHLNIGGGCVELGAESAVASGGKILGGSADPSWPSMSAAARPTRHHDKRMLTTIGPRAVVATNAVVLPGCHLGEGAILAAGAVATRPIPAWEIWGGAPARFIKERPHR
jgi:galactoside O-acetyltransferase